MNQDDRRLIKFACKIHDRLKARAGPVEERSLPVDSWNQVMRFHRMIHKARKRHWFFAAERLRRGIATSIERLQHDLIIAKSSDENTERPVALASEIFADLISLSDEFEEVSIDRQHGTISVTTASIELDGVYLGPFEIVLEWSIYQSDNSLRYRVVALDPHPASTNDAVTHPHVQDETVCEGDGRHAIRIALEQGRILDLFLIVSNLLQTYNDESPYVPLAGWPGIPCNDCDATMLEDEWWSCEKCDSRICEHCYVQCSECDASFCCDCTNCCETCGDRYCGSCITVCTACLNHTCQHCLDELERCPDCYEEENKTTNEPDSETLLHANSVGEAPVPA
ncbi:hypothetical protein [Rubinisphaera italica]|uniref:hypothetical protein n=1 Tax=Rubinisphaera italica TaxID=2527969 RepID=UPI0011B64A0F|nr:hypothetical protein [Rubinisphaera italica]